jgi:hypothetical protein
VSASDKTIRTRLARDPQLLWLAEECRRRFGARLVWLSDADGELGREIPRGIVPTLELPKDLKTTRKGDRP